MSSTNVSTPSETNNSVPAILLVTPTALFKFLTKTSLNFLPVKNASIPLPIKAPTVANDKDLPTTNSSFDITFGLDVFPDE